MSKSHGIRSGVVLATLLAASAACSSSTTSATLPADGLLPLGNWGGDSSAMIASDTATHLHIACTFGDVSGRIALDPAGRFDVAGSYMLRAYPIAVGPTVPARFVGRLSGSTLTVTVLVNDTTQHQSVTRGPVTISLDAEPKLGPCPICRRPIVTKTAAR